MGEVLELILLSYCKAYDCLGDVGKRDKYDQCEEELPEQHFR